MANILFFNPPLRKRVYSATNVSIAAPSYPNLTLATLAGNLLPENNVKILDLDLVDNYDEVLEENIADFKPDLLASSINTPDYFTVRDIMTKVKRKYPQMKTIVGGVHATSMPDEVGKDRCFDFVVIGEGDKVIPELLSMAPESVKGILYYDAFGNRVRTPNRPLINDLDSLPYPAWQLFSIQEYKNSRLSSRENPVGLLETSRGCPFNCNFCNKLTFGRIFRKKNPTRVVDEMEYMLKCGFREIHLVDDNFIQDIKRAKEVCLEILRRKLKFPWSLFNGIRVDLVDFEFLKLAKKAGCWQVAFGIESGDQEILNIVDKRTKLSQIENAVRLAKKAGLDTFGFFILALAGETEESMEKTIAFAKSLPLGMAKFDICIPFPGTRYFQELESQGRIRTKDWLKYNVHQTEEPLFDHLNVSWPTISKYYKRAFREYYLRPSYIARRFIRSLKMGDLWYDFKYFIKAKW